MPRDAILKLLTLHYFWGNCRKSPENESLKWLLLPSDRTEATSGKILKSVAKRGVMGKMSVVAE